MTKDQEKRLIAYVETYMTEHDDAARRGGVFVRPGVSEPCDCSLCRHAGELLCELELARRAEEEPKPS